jgi:hypothetical protein
MIAPMTTSDIPSGVDLPPAEREYIRRELDQFFSTLPASWRKLTKQRNQAVSIDVDFATP